MEINTPTKKFGEVLEKIPKVAGVLTKNYRDRGNFPIVDQGQSLIAGYTDDSSNLYQVELPVVIFGDHTREIKFVDFPFAVGADGTKVLKPISGIDTRYLYFFLHSVDIPARGYARHFSLLKEIQIPLPPVVEQRKIVAQIEKQFAKIDKAARLLEESQALTDQLLHSALHDIFFSAESTGWEEKPLGEIANFIDYRGKTPQKTASGMRLITAKNVKFGFLSQTPEEFVDPSIYDSWMTRGVPNQGDVLFTTEAPLGNVAQLDISERVVFAQRVIILQPKEGLYPGFLKSTLMGGPVRDKILAQATGVTAQGIKASKLKLVGIPLPPLEEQKQIVKKLDAISEKVRALRELQSSQAADFKALKQSILHQVFSGI
ncbi:MAG: restriction endonuclease subunit S [Patescibacteria group bacterium]